MSKSYEELISIKDYHDRFEYLQLYGKVGVQTFGNERYLNQALYHLPIWRSLRQQVIIRDNGCDMAHPDYEIFGTKAYVHHINPITIDDILNERSCVTDLNNLILVSPQTHNAIHYGGQVVRKMLMKERTPNDTCPWKE